MTPAPIEGNGPMEPSPSPRPPTPGGTRQHPSPAAGQRRPPVALVDYGVGNLHSAAKALDRAGADVHVVPTVEAAAGSAALVVPGVGAYGACLAGLGRAGGAEAVAAWIKGGQPVLGICVGMQLLFEGSEEGPVRDGIGAVAGTVRRLPSTVKVPHIGWNGVRVRPGSRLLAGLTEGARFYFVHSYAAENSNPVGDGALL